MSDEMTRRKALEILGFGTAGIAIQPWAMGVAQWNGARWSHMLAKRDGHFAADAAAEFDPTRLTAYVYLYGRVEVPSPDSTALKGKTREEVVRMLDQELAGLKRDFLRGWDRHHRPGGEGELAETATVVDKVPGDEGPPVHWVENGEHRYSHMRDMVDGKLGRILHK